MRILIFSIIFYFGFCSTIFAFTETSTLVENKTENEIPLNFETTKKEVKSESSYFKVLSIFSILGILLVGCWLGIRKYRTQSISRNTNEIKILAQHYLGPKKSLAVVRVAGESILVGVTDTQISLIKSLSLLDDELPEETPKKFTVSNAVSNTDSNADAENNDDDFAVKGIKDIKDIVSTKLKGMRSI